MEKRILGRARLSTVHVWDHVIEGRVRGDARPIPLRLETLLIPEVKFIDINV
jgi:hypothetical protein